jgi:hypothetical protein
MKLSRRDFQTLRSAADVADAQRRLLKRNQEDSRWRDAIIGTAAGLSLLLLSGLAVQSLIDQDRGGNVTEGEQFVWHQVERAPLIR